MAQTFQEFIKSDRTRLNGERRALVAQQRELEKKLVAVDRELAAIVAYESAKSGKAPKAAAAAKAPRKARATRKAAGGRRDSKREPILKLVRDNPAGLSRGESSKRWGSKETRAAR